MKTKTIDDLLVELADNHDAEWCRHYGEPGYHQPETGIVFADWNDIDKEVQTLLEAAGFELEWIDEWYIDYAHGKAWRTAENSYHWQSSLVVTDEGDILTPDDGVQAVFDEVVMTHPKGRICPLPAWVLTEHLIYAGFERANDDWYESGFHHDQNDNPETIAQKLFEQGACEVVFQINQVSQFYTRFSAWAKMKEEE